MGRVSSPDCRGSNRNTFLLAASLYHPSLWKVAGLGFVEAKRRVVGGSASTGRAAMYWLWIRAWSLGRRVDRDVQQGGIVRSAWPHVESGDVGVERAQGSLSRTMDLVMRNRPMVVPGGQVTAELVGMAVRWNVCPSGREQPRVPAGHVTAAIQAQAKGQADIAKTGLSLRCSKGHKKGGSWPGRGGSCPGRGLGRV